MQSQLPSDQSNKHINLFESANKLSAEDKEMILRFLSGNRENPTPEEGPVKTLLINEQIKENKIESVVFEINYDEGTWRKVVKKKALVRAPPSSATKPSADLP